MKYIIYLSVSLSLFACSTQTGIKEKELATQAFINCDFLAAKKNAELALEYAGDNIKVSAPALLIISKSAEFLGQPSNAYEKLAKLSPGINTASDAENIAENFVTSLTAASPDKVKACPKLLGK